jgi:transcriptional regulator with XRE-family HTH domain
MIDSAEVMKRANAAFEVSEMTLEELGKAMGADPATARMTAWQFLRKSTDPRVSMLLRFCAALKMPVEDLLSEKKKSRSK